MEEEHGFERGSSQQGKDAATSEARWKRHETADHLTVNTSRARQARYGAHQEVTSFKSINLNQGERLNVASGGQKRIHVGSSENLPPAHFYNPFDQQQF